MSFEPGTLIGRYRIKHDPLVIIALLLSAVSLCAWLMRRFRRPKSKQWWAEHLRYDPSAFLVHGPAQIAPYQGLRWDTDADRWVLTDPVSPADPSHSPAEDAGNPSIGT